MLRIWKKYVKKAMKLIGVYGDKLETVRIPKVYVNDYGGNLSDFTPPSNAEDGDIIVVVDTNSTNPAQAIYFRANGNWYKVTAS